MATYERLPELDYDVVLIGAGIMSGTLGTLKMPSPLNSKR